MHSDLKQAVLDVTIFRHMRCSCIFQFRTNQPIHQIAFPEMRIEVPAELAILTCTGFF